jgi:hypothetical protein
LAVKAWHAGNRNWLDHLALISALLPHSHELYVTALSTSTRNTLNLAVRVRRSETVDRACSALRAAGYDVRPPAITPVSDRYGYRLQASLELSVPAKVTNDLDHLTVETRPPPHARPTAAAPAATRSPTPEAVVTGDRPRGRHARQRPGSAGYSGRRRHGFRAAKGGAGG